MIRGNSKVVVPQDDVVFCNLNQEEGAVLLNLKDGEYHQLNAVASSIWHFARESRTVDEILALIMKQYKVGKDECKQDLYEVLDDFMAKGLIAINEVDSVT